MATTTTPTDLTTMTSDELTAERDRLEAEYQRFFRTLTVSAPLEIKHLRERHMHETALRVAEIDVEAGRRWIASRDQKAAELEQLGVETPEILAARTALEEAQAAYDALAGPQQAARSELWTTQREAVSARKRLNDLQHTLHLRQEAIGRLEAAQGQAVNRAMSLKHAYEERRAEVRRMEARQ